MRWKKFRSRPCFWTEKFSDIEKISLSRHFFERNFSLPLRKFIFMWNINRSLSLNHVNIKQKQFSLYGVDCLDNFKSSTFWILQTLCSNIKNWNRRRQTRIRWIYQITASTVDLQKHKIGLQKTHVCIIF